MENNRYEEVEKKENIFAKLFKCFIQYLKNLGYDFIASFKYNNMKLPSLLIAFPGVFFGFFLGFHSKLINDISFVSTVNIVNGVSENVYYCNLSFDFTGICIFVLMLFSILNIFSSSAVSKKKNLGSVVIATITTCILSIAGIIYLSGLFIWINGKMEYTNKINELLNTGMSLTDAQTAARGIGISGDFSVNSDLIICIISVILSIIASITGCILGFIFYDRTYEKADR